MKKKFVIVILGATASGKTDVSIELSKLMDIEIISADSRQIYKYLDIGTAKPTSQQMKKVKHYYIDILEPDKYYSAGRFGTEAAKTIELIFKKNKLPVVVGGSGLYIKALCEGLFDEPVININTQMNLRKQLESKLKIEGIETLYEKLLTVDPISAARYDDRNPRRILRALEYFELTGVPFSIAQEKYSVQRIFEPIYFGIDLDRNSLYHRINIRAENMWNSGLVEETERVLSMGYSSDLNSLNTVGYKETIQFINGKIDGSIALELIKRNTRRYAKRQLTWFKAMDNVIWLSGTSKEIAGRITEIVRYRV